MDPIASFKRRLTETIAWCAAHEWAADPAVGLRTASLRPSELKVNDVLLLEQTPQQRQQIVEHLAVKRTELLDGQEKTSLQLALPLTSGRLLAFAPDQSLSDGAAYNATHGFFDADNVPAWDTWIAYVIDDPVRNPAWNPVDSYLLSWVPEPLVQEVGYGIGVIPEDCIFWATDLDALFMRQLLQAGLVL